MPGSLGKRFMQGLQKIIEENGNNGLRGNKGNGRGGGNGGSGSYKGVMQMKEKG